MAVKLKKYPKDKLGALIPHPTPDANKYTRGKLVAVGGAKEYPGAICLASSAALRMGAGYVEVACAPETLSTIHSFNPNVVAKSWEGWTVASAYLDEVDMRNPRCCLVGSGLDAQDPGISSLVISIIENVKSPILVDGGAITVLASEEGRKAAIKRAEDGYKTVVTPHFGEASRLGKPLRIPMPDDPFTGHDDDARFAQQIADAYGAYIVLKGAQTYIAKPNLAAKTKDETVLLMKHGTAALAKAGTGDVLAGIISGLLAQDMPCEKAAYLGAYLHAEAGRLAACDLTDVSVVAEDLISYLPKAIKQFC